MVAALAPVLHNFYKVPGRRIFFFLFIPGLEYFNSIPAVPKSCLIVCVGEGAGIFTWATAVNMMPAVNKTEKFFSCEAF